VLQTSKLKFLWIIFILISLWAYWIITTHPKNAIVSWDEGFHGGAAFYISESLRNNFSFIENRYILNDFKNGIIFYMPLWWGSAGVLGAVFNPSIEIYRFTTTLFSVFSLFVIYYFAKKYSDFKAAIISVFTLALTPIFIVYSHLMMIEVPLLFSVTLALVFYYRYLTKKKLTKTDLLITLATFILGVMTKITAVSLIVGVILAYGLVVWFLFKDTLIGRRFFSKWTLIFLLASLLTFWFYRMFTRLALNSDMLIFYLNQMQNLSGYNDSLIASVLSTLRNFSFYLNDFSHMKPLTILWIGSLISYLILKRSPLGFYLVIWVGVTYLIFSAVRPQAAQYILPIFAPLSIATGLFWGEFLKLRSDRLRPVLFVMVILMIVWLNNLFLKNTGTLFWRTLITYQEQAADWIAYNSKSGDRILTSGDGSRFLVRVKGQQKKLQTINAAALTCTGVFNDSSEWAIVDFGPQNPVKLKEVDKINWKETKNFLSQTEKTRILNNENDTKTVVLAGDNLSTAHCKRFLRLGINKIKISATPLLKEAKFSENSYLKIQLRVNPAKVVKEELINKEVLLSQIGIVQEYLLEYNQLSVNQPIYLSIESSHNIELKISKVEISSIN
jgi:4-amino-4-deoxy-L-arabinose transferase-like glycosyltransferase